MKTPPFKGLWYFKTAAQLGSFKQAAEALFVTQAAVSQQIRILEHQLGCTLFERQTRKVSLTQQGQELLPYLQTGFGQIETGLSALKSDPNPNTIHLSVLPSFATCWLLPRLTSFNSALPDYQLRIDPTEQLADFNREDIDIGIRFGLGDYPGLKSELIAQDELVIAYRPGVINPSKPLRPQLTQLNFIYDEGRDNEVAWRNLSTQLGLKGHTLSNLKIDNAALVQQATVAGQGFSLLRKRMVAQSVEMGQLEIHPEFAWQCEYSYHLVAPESHFAWPKVQAFRNWIVSELNGMTLNQS
ncbi:LysR substrate-binding domain-containing protein [Pseudoalteromonas luteoviolacea]|uniref:LysR family transcriptional regulator n=1 Tax=Pseudoalteromonas luteoviolacea S4054 TaxID=1129367 RepID=A0A0F6AHP4_9GAMM|nr:LysR substrate-binding domain-containing protein [Pseudoalteromonas luteoviolacea]AOT10446.1 LysR family transcriptional regulator [Pseudoalteromonas luteoviolacea]AOT15485.1 LysR family transcriptional regulator [Pseudoalteromonas luteoviolacea]AOT20265.1 LysR family transcriptional regulator [Pseudoalteromonas luteoviolacea]KKE85678.1 LysR family transcriptional regulator [Pseudoalteromonas luteoviolacea S4054]KZN73179.1 LysR family transcriptional regulator [Pseudoalteromonas luteoviolac